MFLKILIALIILIILHFLIKNYLLTHNSNNTSTSTILSEFDNLKHVNNEESKETVSPYQKLNNDDINTNINNDYHDKINKQFNKDSENPNLIQNKVNTDAKNNLLDFINNSIQKNDNINGYNGEIKSTNVSLIKQSQNMNSLASYFEETKNEDFNELNGDKDTSNKTFCVPTEKTNVKNTPFNDTSCLQGLDPNSKWRGKNFLLPGGSDGTNNNNVLNGGVMPGGLLAFDNEDGLYSEY
jgi:hypothetical protein